MVKAAKGTSIIHTFARKERGVTVPVSKQQITMPDGSVGLSVGIDLSAVEVPDRSYYAEVCGLAYENVRVKFMFGQMQRNGKPRSLIIISMTPHAAAMCLDLVDRLATPSLDEILLRTQIEKGRLTDFPEDPEETAALKASMVAMAFFGRDACLDFYDASPFSWAGAQSSSKMTVLGVVRINTDTALVAAMVDRLREFQAQFPADARTSGGIHGKDI